MSASTAQSDLGALSQQSSYPSFPSTSTARSDARALGAQPAEKMDLCKTDERAPVVKPELNPASESGSTIAHLSYAPTTQTTVVTTTTTTTTSFPPFVVPAPRRLTERDPKQYPLASSPTPQSLKRFSFNYMGKPVSFEEGDNAEQTLVELSQTYAALHDARGTVQSVAKYEGHCDSPDRRLLPRTRSQAASLSFDLAIPKIRKRSASPVSISEAAEIASLHRRNKKPRSSLPNLTGELGGHLPGHTRDGVHSSDDTELAVPATPDTDAGSSGQFKLPSSGTGGTGEHHSQATAHLRDGDGQSQPASLLSSSMVDESSQGSWNTDAFFGPRARAAGMSATPPIAEHDLEPVAVGPTAPDASQNPRPRPLQTASLQDASLPSPSLSPITAAANLSNAFPEQRRVSHGHENVHDERDLDLSRDFIALRARNGITSAHAVAGHSDQHAVDTPGLQVSSSTTMDIPSMLNTFDAMPDELKTYVMYQLLRRSAKSTLHLVAEVVNPALKCDFLGILPMELSLNVLKYLDARSLCRAAQVSKKWRHIVNSDETGWKNLLDRDGYGLPHGEVERAVREGWGWQYPHGPTSFERDLSVAPSSKYESDGVATSPKSMASVDSDATTAPPTLTSAASRPKRKAAAKFGTAQKRQRRKGPSTAKARSASWAPPLESAQGPIAFANAAAKAVPNPQVGLPGLRSLHLFKSLYQRHHLIRKSWMDASTRPQHVAFRAHQRHVVTCLQFDTDKILTGSDDTNINVYDTRTGALRSRLEGHEGGVWALQYEGNTLVSGSTDRSVRVWDIEKGKCTQTFQGHTSTVRCLVILKPTVIGEEADRTPIVMPKEPLIITGSRDSSLRVWKLPQPGDKTFHQLASPSSDLTNPYFVRALTGHHQSVRAIAAHGDTLVSGSYDTSVRVWKISTGELLHRLQGHQQKVYSVVLDHERGRCISGSMDNLVKVWSLDTGACLFNLEGHTSLVGLLDLSHGRLVSAAADSTLRIWDPESGQCKSTLSAHTGAITCFQHDGQKVISGSDRTLKMWDVRTGECVKDLLTELSGVWQVKFNDRRCVAAVQRNNLTYIEVLDFGAARDGIPADRLGRRIVVDAKGLEVDDGEAGEEHT